MIVKLRNSRTKMKNRAVRGEGEKMKAKEKKVKTGEVKETKMKNQWAEKCLRRLV